MESSDNAGDDVSMSTQSVYSALGLSPEDVEALAQIPENEISVETLPYLIMQLKAKRAEKAAVPDPPAAAPDAPAVANVTDSGEKPEAELQQGNQDTEASEKQKENRESPPPSGSSCQVAASHEHEHHGKVDGHRKTERENTGERRDSRSRKSSRETESGDDVTPEEKELDDKPTVFPHTCSLCMTESNGSKAWHSHIHGIRHIKARRKFMLSDSVDDSSHRGSRSSAPSKRSYSSERSAGDRSSPSGERFFQPPKPFTKVVAAKFPMGSMAVSDMLALGKPFGTIVKHLIFPFKGFLEFNSHTEAKNMVTYYQTKPAFIKGQRITLCLSPNVEVIHPPDAYEPPSKRSKSSPPSVVCFSRLPPGKEAEEKVLDLAALFGDVRCSKFTEDKALIEMVDWHDADIMVKYYHSNPLRIQDRSVKVSMSSRSTLRESSLERSSSKKSDSSKSHSSSSRQKSEPSSSKSASQSSSKDKEKTDEKEKEEKKDGENKEGEETQIKDDEFGNQEAVQPGEEAGPDEVITTGMEEVQEKEEEEKEVKGEEEKGEEEEEKGEEKREVKKGEEEKEVKKGEEKEVKKGEEEKEVKKGEEKEVKKGEEEKEVKKGEEEKEVKKGEEEKEVKKGEEKKVKKGEEKKEVKKREEEKEVKKRGEEKEVKKGGEEMVDCEEQREEEKDKNKGERRSEEEAEEQNDLEDIDFPENMDDFVTLDELDTTAGDLESSKTQEGKVVVVKPIRNEFKETHKKAVREALLKMAAPFGEVVNFAISYYRHEALIELESVARACEMVNYYSSPKRSKLCGRPVSVLLCQTYNTIEGPSGRTLFISMLPHFKYSDKSVLRLARPFGKITAYCFNRVYGTCYIQMETVEAAEKMIQRYLPWPLNFYGTLLKVTKCRKGDSLIPWTIADKFEQWYEPKLGRTIDGRRENGQTTRISSGEERRSPLSSSEGVCGDPAGEREDSEEEDKGKTPLGPYKPDNPVGISYVVPKSGFYCKLCNVFYTDEKKAKSDHCSSLEHYNMLLKKRGEATEEEQTHGQTEG